MFVKVNARVIHSRVILVYFIVSVKIGCSYGECKKPVQRIFVTLSSLVKLYSFFFCLTRFHRLLSLTDSLTHSSTYICKLYVFFSSTRQPSSIYTFFSIYSEFKTIAHNRDSVGGWQWKIKEEKNSKLNYKRESLLKKNKTFF